MRKITLEISDEVYGMLAAIAPGGSVEELLSLVVDHVQQGVYRPGSWERDWLAKVIPESDIVANLEPGDPYGRGGFEGIFQRPKSKQPKPRKRKKATKKHGK